MVESIRETLKNICQLCESIDSSDIRVNNSKPLKKIVLDDLIGYIVYIVDGQSSSISDSSCKRIKELLEENMTPMELGSYITSEGIHVVKFGVYPSEVMDILITAENCMYENDDENAGKISELYILMYIQVAGYVFSKSDKVTPEQKERKNHYINEMSDYRCQRADFPTKRIDASASDDEDDSMQECESLEELMEQLEDLTGLYEVKQEVRSLVNLIRMRNIREQRGMKKLVMSLHLVFSGNPGTGKTTVARLLSKIYYRLGVLSKGHLVETDRSGLVGGYVGQTALKVQEVVQKSMGGILFIDEAYALTVDKGGNDYGQEAVDTLLKAMEDNRDDLIIIVAGYPDLMERFLDSNPGLRSRFRKTIEFYDYSPTELMSIFNVMCRNAGYQVSGTASKYVFSHFQQLTENKRENFANGREVRNFFESAILRQANRLAECTNPSDLQIQRLQLSDFMDSEDYPFNEVEGSEAEQDATHAQQDIQECKILNKGERWDISEFTASALKFQLCFSSMKCDVDLDAYLFLLLDNGKASCDEDLIFFGNNRSADDSAWIGEEEWFPSVHLDLSKLSPGHKKAAICFSAYGDDPALNFSRLNDLKVKVFYNGRLEGCLEIKNITVEKTLVAMEIYQHGGKWKASCTASGYKNKLEALCRDYGINIE